MKKINYKSDFDFILRLVDCRGEEIGWPDYDWVARFWTSLKVNAFEASCRGGKAVNCYNDNGKIHIVANSHKLSAGVLNVEFISELPDGIYPDGAERNVVPVPLEIELIRTAAPCPESFEVELMLPYIKGEKGDPFTSEDFTPEQWADIQRPAVEAAAAAASATEKAVSEMQAEVRDLIDTTQSQAGAWSEAESRRAEAEVARKGNEADRVSSEEERVQAEAGRVSAETLREQAERQRADAETTRLEAERQRVASETAREQAEQERKAAETLRQEKSEYGSYTLDFGETSTQASDFNLCGDISVEQLTMLNIASLTVANGESVIELTPDTFLPFAISNGANVAWRIVRTAEGQQAAIGVKYRVTNQ